MSLWMCQISFLTGLALNMSIKIEQGAYSWLIAVVKLTHTFDEKDKRAIIMYDELG